MTCHWQTRGEMRNPPSRYTSFLIMFVERSGEMLFIQLKATNKGPADWYSFCYYALILNQWGCDMGKLHSDTRVMGDKGCLCTVTSHRLEDSVTLQRRRTHQSALLWQSLQKDHNIISRQERTCWWNICEAEGRWTSANINTNTASQNDWLHLRACCEKSIQHSNPLCPPAFTC